MSTSPSCPWRDGLLTSLENWITTTIAAVTDAHEHQLVRSFATWHHVRCLRARSSPQYPVGTTSVGAGKDAVMVKRSLFAHGELRDELQRRRRAVRDYLRSLDLDTLLLMPEADLVANAIQAGRVESIELHRDGIVRLLTTEPNSNTRPSWRTL